MIDPGEEGYGRVPRMVEYWKACLIPPCGKRKQNLRVVTNKYDSLLLPIGGMLFLPKMLGAILPIAEIYGY
jgi:hypothetical protein